MEDGHGKASSDEASSAEPAHDNAGSRRPYYECTFCKRGFSNAQALGGHMNIHRKDRARERQAPAMASVQERAEQDSEGYGYYNQYANNYSAFYPPTYEPFRGYTTYFPASSSSSSLCSGRDDVRMAGSSRTPYETSMLGEELSLGLSTYVDGDVVTGGGRKRQEVEEAELDLELRLGHHQP